MNWTQVHHQLYGTHCYVALLEEQYVVVNLISSGMMYEFREISEQEYQTFEQWKDDGSFLDSIKERPVFCIGYWGHHEFRSK